MNMGGDLMLPVSLTAAFIAGVAGSVHCVAMCGGIAGALGLWARRQGQAAPTVALHVAGQQFGRLTSYALAGALCGAFGSALVMLVRLEPVVLAVRVCGGLMLMAVACRALFGWQLTAPLERLGARLFARLMPRAGAMPARGLRGAVLLGMGWGWLPCGLVYTMLVFAATTGSAARGAATMALFGAGTLPMLLAGSVIGARLTPLTLARGLYRGAGVLLMGFGALTVIGPFIHTHFCP